MILVIGGTGFLGSRLLKALVDSGETDITCTHRLRLLKYVPIHVARYIEWQPANVLDVGSLDDVIQQADIVFHCAGKVSFNARDEDEMYKVNVEGTANIVNSCISHKVKKFIYVSSVAALGRKADLNKIAENNQWQESKSNTVYAKSKYAAEMEVWRGMAEGLNSVIVNPSILIGPSQSWDEGSMLLFKNMYDGFSWYTNGINGFVNVDDVARAMIALMNSNVHGERFILNGDNWSYQQLFSTIKQHLSLDTKLKYASPWMSEFVWRIEKMRERFTGKKSRVTKETARTANLKVSYDNSKIKSALPGFEFTPLEKTIEEACESFLQNLEKEKQKGTLEESSA